MNTVDPIRDTRKIQTIKKILIADNRIRDYTLFTLGINSALRISDLLKLKVGDFFDRKGKIKDMLYIRETKTGKEKAFAINDSIKEALTRYKKTFPDMTSENYMFRSRNGENKPIQRTMAWLIIKNICEEVGVEGTIGTHSLRKTWGYWQWKKGTSPVIIMEALNHSDWSVTKRYLGITQDEINEAYMSVNL